MKPLLILSALVIAATLAAQAGAAKVPIFGADAGQAGVAGPGGHRFVTLPSGADTIVAVVRQRSGEISSYRRLPGRYTIPAVAYDGTAGGLSADGRTLVLTRPRLRFPRAESSFLVVDTRTLRTTRRLTLAADWSFDAISPDGRYLYLIEYTDPRDTSRYAVRLYDLTRGRLAPEPIVDPHEADEAMRGSPLTRVSSPDGRWEYTLYDGGGKEPFVHALDTVGRTARCIDLEELSWLIGSDMSQLRMRLRDGGLIVDAGGSPFLRIDTTTFAVREPAPAAASAPVEPAAPAEPDRGGWWIPVLTLLVLAAIFGVAVFRRLPRLARPWRSHSSTTPNP
jgi:hypothetical protein